MHSTAFYIFTSFLDNEILMLIAMIAMFAVAKIDQSLSKLQKNLSYYFAVSCMVYTLFVFIGFGIDTTAYPISNSLRIFCISMLNIIRPLPLVLIAGGLSGSLGRKKLFYLPLAINAILFLVNILHPICFVLTEDKTVSKFPVYYVSVIVFLIYFVILAYVYLTYSLIKSVGQKLIALLILIIIPLALIGELHSNRNVLGTAILLADIFEYELLIVLRSNKLLATKDNDLKLSQKESISDDMTGLFNRRAYDRRIEQEMQRSSIRQDLVFVVCDINGLKATNDNFGHKEGDDMIIAAAECLRAAFGKYGDIYRIGGDEFTALLNCSKSQLDEMLESLDSLCRNWKNPDWKVLTISKGYACVKDYPGTDIPSLVKLADQKMYADKEDFYRTHAALDRRKR